MANPELRGIEIQIEIGNTSDPYWQAYYVSPDGNQRSPKLRGIEIECGETFSDEFPLTGVVAGGTKSRSTKSVGTKGVIH